MTVKPKLLIFMTLIALILLGSTPPSVESAREPVVNAVLFYSPTCPHCHIVINEDLPPLLEKYGNQLNIIAINVSAQEGQLLYQMMYQQYELTQDRLGVPAMVIGDTVLVGSQEIPEEFPGLIEHGLASGGLDYPEIPGLEEFLIQNELVSPKEPTIAEKFTGDVVGNSLSVIVLLVMVVSLGAVAYLALFKPQIGGRPAPAWAIPILAMVGMAVAAYLSYVEITQTEAVCGPVGDCNAVQGSEYAQLFGVLPVGIIGMSGYVLILAAWLVSRYGKGIGQKLGSVAVSGLALVALLFMIYLTFLEPFVIGATCAWCLTTAVIITLILWASLNDGIRAWKSLTI